jgi:hypothetical protein
MNLLCPNCQKMLTVPEECAGQLMQCPLCRGTFTMPALPQPAAAAAAAPAGSPKAPPPADTFSVPLPATGAYQGADQPPPVPPSPQAKGKPSGPPPVDWDTSEPMAPDLVPPPATAGRYRHAIPLWISPRFLRWAVPIALILVLVLSFFSWIGAYPGGIGLFTQNGWRTAFGGWSEDKDLVEKVRGNIPEEAPGASVWMIFYVILLCIAALLAIAVIVFNVLPGPAPPFVENLKPWQGLILGGVAGLAFLFLAIQVLAGFPLKNKLTSEVSKQFEAMGKADEGKAGAGKKLEVMKGMGVGALSIRYTFWFRLVVTLTLLAAVGGSLEFWILRRGNRPLPKLEFAW